MNHIKCSRDREKIHQASWILKWKRRMWRVEDESSPKYNGTSHEREWIVKEENWLPLLRFAGVHSLPEPAYGANAKTTLMPLSTTVTSLWLMDPSCSSRIIFTRYFLHKRNFSTIFLKFPISLSTIFWLTYIIYLLIIKRSVVFFSNRSY